MTRLCILKAGETFPETAARLGDFEDWLIAGLGLPGHDIQILDPRREPALPELPACAGAIMTGSHAMVTDDTPWMRRTADWLARLVEAERPFLGICFGHQMLARAFGGRVDYHPGGREIGTVEIERAPAAADDPLFQCLPARFRAHAAHAQSVRELPAGAVHLAGNDFEPHHAFRLGPAAWGVQFHPEFGRAHMAAYIDRLAPAGTRPNLADTPEAAALLARFADLAYASAPTIASATASATSMPSTAADRMPPA